MKKLLWPVLFFVLMCNLSAAATIVGKTYDFSLDKIDDVIVKIDSYPVQTYVSKEGVYKFTVKPGNYTINASYYDNNELKLFTSQNIVVKDDGEYRLDLILFEMVDFEGDIREEDFVFGDEPAIDVKTPLVAAVLIVIMLLVLAAAASIIVVLWPRKQKLHAEGDAEKILACIKKARRLTQKDLRKAFPYSEAKISLIIADLESRGIVRKIKKGRGNIIIYNRP